MSAVTFSPGPWELGERKKYRVLIDAPKDRFPWSGLAKVVVRMADDKEDYPRGLANANLIVAAPEMYEALSDIMETALQAFPALANQPQFVRGAAALAKARGEQ